MFLLGVFMPIQSLSGQNPGLYREVVSGGGGEAVLGGQTFSYTLGEAFVETFEGPAQVLTQGFQQPESNIMIGVPELAWAADFKIFPNPTSESLQIEFNAPSGIQFDLQVFNQLGQSVLLMRRLDDSVPRSVDCRVLPAGTYWLTATAADGKLLFRAPFVKALR